MRKAAERPAHFRISSVTLDEQSAAPRNAVGERERKIAIHDLLHDNRFAPKGSPGGPYRLHLSVSENRLVLDIRLADGGEHGRILLSLTPFKRALRDYFAICESYHAALRAASPTRAEAVDMARRGLHDEGAAILRERLEGKVELDFATARRLFTLLCALHFGG